MDNKFDEFYSWVLNDVTEPPEQQSRHEEPEDLRTLFHNILDEIIVHIEQRFKMIKEFKFVELLNLKLFHTYEKQFLTETFSSLNVYKNILELDGLKCELKSVYAADFAKQVSSIQEVADIIWELELNQALAEVTKLLHLILTIPATSASSERSFTSLK
uniref:HAT C-terminal dimerisation domain-containing protein n=1 Tax=Octopus bimaculoides TaxID=37653 RepID=A0A0L8G6U0_OCTBM